MNDKAVPTVEVAPGVTVNANMSPEERFAIVSKAVGAPVPTRPEGARFAATGMTDHTAAELARGDARAAARAAKAPPPSAPAKPVAPPQGTPAERARDPAGFTPATPASGEVQIDQAAIDKLNEVWRAMTPEQREAKRATYEHDLKTIFEGRKLGESVAQFEARKTGTTAQVPNEPVEQTHTPADWEKGHASVTDKDGWIPIDRVNSAALSGYTLPKLIEGQQYHSSVFAQLADARAAGLTQAQVESYIRQQMKRDGYLE